MDSSLTVEPVRPLDNHPETCVALEIEVNILYILLGHFSIEVESFLVHAKPRS